MRDVHNDGEVVCRELRLPDTIKPRHYDIEVEPNAMTMSFRGRVTMHLQVLNETNMVVFHSVRLALSDARVNFSDGSAIAPDVHINADDEVAYVTLDRHVKPGHQLSLSLRFRGKMNTPGSMYGIYPCPYTAPNGEIKALVCTMATPKGARQIYPCMDEPALKATFSVSLIAETDLTCLSNMDIAAEQMLLPSPAGKARKRVKFNRSPPMSTYLLVFVIGELQVRETQAFRVPIRVFCAPDKSLHGADLILDAAVKAMVAYERSYGLPYPLPKMDLVAVPGNQGGMEHWGCITFGELFLLLEPDSAAITRLQMQYMVTHELGHQWFGNLVTMHWWDQVWLNESFTDWATHHALDDILKDEWPEWTDFVSKDYQAALYLDCNRGTHAIVDPRVPVSMAFDQIAYLKGCSIIRMMAEEIGVAVFLAGIHQYLASHAYANATTTDLWAALTRASGRDVAALMDAWTRLPGYPLLEVHELRPTSEIVVSQRRFVQTGVSDSDEIYPLSLRTILPGGIDEHARLTTRRDKFPAVLFQYKLNADQAGYYRVTYPLSRWHKLAAQFCEPGFLSARDQAGLIADITAATASVTWPGRTTTTADLLAFIRTAAGALAASRPPDAQHEHLFAWRSIVTQLARLDVAWMSVPDAGLRRALRSFTTCVLAPLLAPPLGAAAAVADDATTQRHVFAALCFAAGVDAGWPATRRAARAMFERLVRSGGRETIPPPIRRKVFESVLMDDDDDAVLEKTYTLIRAIALQRILFPPTAIHASNDALLALAAARAPHLIAQTLDLALPTPSGRPPAAAAASPVLVLTGAMRTALIATVARQHARGARAAWAWMRRNWDALVRPARTTGGDGGDDEGDGNGAIGSVSFIGGCLAGLSTAAELAEVEAFFREGRGRQVKAAKFTLAQAMDDIRARAQWVEADRDGVQTWLRAEGYYH